MELDWFSRHVVPTAFALLPDRLDSVEARALVGAICLQESGLRHRRQIARKAQGNRPPVYGPAKGLAQFELIACTEVMTGHSTRDVARGVLEGLLYPDRGDMEVHAALEHNDILAVAFARLFLWPDPEHLPGRRDVIAGWGYYLRRWRPGMPHEEKWAENYRLAWDVVGTV